ncbi:response regulator transcription factor [[Clostridium] colinum]|uniref:response regulator transcription factor n=1 Tax=[Clostridium] colinum TaxID=36835 RepID=UPI0020247E53|nr:response regulator transcription factor [[Clostridium] colinum]
MQNIKHKILIADDEKDIRDILNILLTSEGYDVVLATNGQEALSLANNDIDLYILDVNMSIMNGFVASSEIRKNFFAPIIFLTAYTGESDKVMGFSVGADDYITKPFSNMEILLKVKALIRRSKQYNNNNNIEQNKSNNKIIFKDLILDLDSQSVIKDDNVIVLTYTEFKILELFITNHKKIYSLENIYQSIWEEDAIGDNTIMVHIKNLRKKLGDSSKNPKYIKTAWGKGYYVN